MPCARKRSRVIKGFVYALVRWLVRKVSLFVSWVYSFAEIFRSFFAETFRSFVSQLYLNSPQQCSSACIFRDSDRNYLSFSGHFKNISACDRKMPEKKQFVSKRAKVATMPRSEGNASCLVGFRVARHAWLINEGRRSFDNDCVSPFATTRDSRSQRYSFVWADYAQARDAFVCHVTMSAPLPGTCCGVTRRRGKAHCSKKKYAQPG